MTDEMKLINLLGKSKIESIKKKTGRNYIKGFLHVQENDTGDLAIIVCNFNFRDKYREVVYTGQSPTETELERRYETGVLNPPFHPPAHYLF